MQSPFMRLRVGSYAQSEEADPFGLLAMDSKKFTLTPLAFLADESRQCLARHYGVHKSGEATQIIRTKKSLEDLAKMSQKANPRDSEPLLDVIRQTGCLEGIS